MLAASFGLVMSNPITADAQIAYDRIVVFGTSLSDPGNGFALTGTTSTPPYDSLDLFLTPDAPYARGGHHLSNGATWVEQLARSSALAASVRPAFRGNNAGATNYAVARARARDVGESIDLSPQVQTFLVDVGGVAPSDALYVIEMGSNDVRDALDPTNPDPFGTLGEALTSIANNIATLYAAGARNFLVWNVPNLAQSPAIQIADSVFPGTAEATTDATEAFNSGLKLILEQQLPALLPGINLIQFDAYQVTTDVAADPSAVGLTNVTDSCVTPLLPPFTCADPDEYLFWDGIHPTRAAHGIIAEAVALVLAE